MAQLYTEDDLRLEAQIARCKMSVYEYFQGNCITIDYEALFRKLDPPSLLFQFAHMIAFHNYDWKRALLWVNDNRSMILAYAEGKIDEWGDQKNAEVSAAAGTADPKADP